MTTGGPSGSRRRIDPALFTLACSRNDENFPTSRPSLLRRDRRLPHRRLCRLGYLGGKPTDRQAAPTTMVLHLAFDADIIGQAWLCREQSDLQRSPAPCGRFMGDPRNGRAPCRGGRPAHTRPQGRHARPHDYAGGLDDHRLTRREPSASVGSDHFALASTHFDISLISFIWASMIFCAVALASSFFPYLSSVLDISTAPI